MTEDELHFVVDDIIAKHHDGKERSETLFYLIVKGGNVAALKAVCTFFVIVIEIHNNLRTFVHFL